MTGASTDRNRIPGGGGGAGGGSGPAADHQWHRSAHGVPCSRALLARCSSHRPCAAQASSDGSRAHTMLSTPHLRACQAVRQLTRPRAPSDVLPNPEFRMNAGRQVRGGGGGVPHGRRQRGGAGRRGAGRPRRRPPPHRRQRAAGPHSAFQTLSTPFRPPPARQPGRPGVRVAIRTRPSRLLLPALQGALDENAAGQDALRRTAQLTANAAALAAAAPALDDFTLQRVR